MRREARFYLLCLIIGAVTGLITVPYRYLLVKSGEVRDLIFGHSPSVWTHLGVITLMWMIALLIHRIVIKYPLISGSGIPQVEGVIYGRFRFKHPFQMLWAKFMGGILGIGMGLSLGREGPSVQMGSLVAQLVAKWAKVGTAHRKYLITAGASAGLSSAFTAPLASAIFVVEEMEKFDSVKITISTLLGGIVSGWMAHTLITTNEYADIAVNPPTDIVSWQWAIIFVAFALLLSLIGKAFNGLLLAFQSGYLKSKIPVAIKLLAVVTVTYILGYTLPGLVSGGDRLLISEATGEMRSGLVFLTAVIVIKLIFTPLCYATGFPGGIFLPLLVIGGLTGKWFALCLSQLGVIEANHSGFFMLIGMSALFAAVVRSPITGLILIIEMTGKFTLFFPMVIVVGFTYVVSQYLGVKPIYDLLYQRMLPADVQDTEQRCIVPFEVCEDSYMEGRTIDQLKLPEHCQIKRIVSGLRTTSSLDTVLQVGDRVEIELDSKDLEKLYRSFRSMANE